MTALLAGRDDLANLLTSDRDAVGWLSVYLGLLLFIPSRLIVGALGSAGAPSMLFGLGSLLLWALLFFRAQRWGAPGPQPIRFALALFLLSVGVSYVLAMSKPVSTDETSPADVAVLALVSWSGTLLLSHDGIRGRIRLQLLVWRFAVCGGLIAALGLIQVATRKLWVDLISVPGLTSSAYIGISGRGNYIRPSGTSIHPIEYGVLLAMILPLVLHVAFHQRSRRPILRWLPALAVLAVVPLTSSRSAYLGSLVALIVCMIGWPASRRIRALAVGVAGTIAMTAIAPNFVNSVVALFSGASEDPSITSRTDSFSLAYVFFDRDPWFGRGLGTFLPKYRIFDNQYLLLLVTIGIVGLVTFVAVGVVAVATTLRTRSRLLDDESRDLAVALCASISAGFACLIMFDAFAFPMTMGALFLIIGIAGALRRISLSEPKTRTADLEP